jgi:hypothetical protein
MRFATRGKPDRATIGRRFLDSKLADPCSPNDGIFHPAHRDGIVSRTGARPAEGGNHDKDLAAAALTAMMGFAATARAQYLIVGNPVARAIISMA